MSDPEADNVPDPETHAILAEMEAAIDEAVTRALTKLRALDRTDTRGREPVPA